MPVVHHKQEFPPLLAQGFHEMSVGELRGFCVEGFPDSLRRQEIMAGFELIHEQLELLSFTGEIWVDGSFLTKKLEPDDIDFVVMMPSAFYDSGTEDQKQFIEWLVNNEDDPKKSFRCHTDVGLLYESSHPFWSLTVETLRHWEHDVYGYSVATREPKGIVIVKLPTVPQVLPVESGTVVREGAEP